MPLSHNSFYNIYITILLVEVQSKATLKKNCILEGETAQEIYCQQY